MHWCNAKTGATMFRTWTTVHVLPSKINCTRALFPRRLCMNECMIALNKNKYIVWSTITCTAELHYCVVIVVAIKCSTKMPTFDRLNIRWAWRVQTSRDKPSQRNRQPFTTTVRQLLQSSREGQVIKPLNNLFLTDCIWNGVLWFIGYITCEMFWCTCSDGWVIDEHHLMVNTCFIYLKLHY